MHRRDSDGARFSTTKFRASEPSRLRECQPSWTNPFSWARGDFTITVKPPAFQFYAADFLVGTATMTVEEVGAYIRLLCYQWDRGFLPDNDIQLSRLAACSIECISSIREKFYVESGVLKNARLEKVRNDQEEYRKAQSDNGKMGASKRWHSDPNGGAIATPMATGMANRMAKNSSPSPSPSPSPNSDHTLQPKPEEAAKPRERNVLFDALCLFEGIPLDQVGAKTGARIATALKEIKAISPDVTAEEIHRRGNNYSTHFSTTKTAMALASHWGKCFSSNGVRSVVQAEVRRV
jgi:uncharacterized protein YdaU (DUF1376 family)